MNSMLTDSGSSNKFDNSLNGNVDKMNDGGARFKPVPTEDEVNNSTKEDNVKVEKLNDGASDIPLLEDEDGKIVLDEYNTHIVIHESFLAKLRYYGTKPLLISLGIIAIVFMTVMAIKVTHIKNDKIATINQSNQLDIDEGMQEIIPQNTEVVLSRKQVDNIADGLELKDVVIGNYTLTKERQANLVANHMNTNGIFLEIQRLILYNMCDEKDIDLSDASLKEVLASIGATTDLSLYAESDLSYIKTQIAISRLFERYASDTARQLANLEHITYDEYIEHHSLDVTTNNMESINKFAKDYYRIYEALVPNEVKAKYPNLIAPELLKENETPKIVKIEDGQQLSVNGASDYKDLNDNNK